MSKEIQRLGEPLVPVICAYRAAGVAGTLVLRMQGMMEKWSRRGFNGIDFQLLDVGDKPRGLLLENVHPNGRKFSPKILERGNGILVMPVHNSRCVEKRADEFASHIFHMVWRGNRWRDRAGNVHCNPY